MPHSLEVLSCERNKMVQLPIMPSSLLFLDCRYNYFQYEPIIEQECKIYYYPQEKDIMEIPYGSENALVPELIMNGDVLVDFDKESHFKRYYKKSSFEQIPEPKTNPVTRELITDKKLYLARVISAKKKKGGKRRTLRIQR